MKKLYFIVALAGILTGLGGIQSEAQSIDAYNNFCQIGGQNVLTSNLPSSNKFQQTFPGCTVTVFLTGTSTKVSLFSNPGGTVLSNPFTADTEGFFKFYAATGVHYDVTISNAGMPSPRTYPDIIIGGGGGVSGCGSVSGDDSSTTCGTGNRAGDTASLPATIQVYGFNNLPTNSADHLVVAGNSNGNSLFGQYGVLIGDNEANFAHIDPEDPYRSAVFIGRNDIGGTSTDNNGCIIEQGGVFIGDSNANPCQGQELEKVVMIGSGNLQNSGGDISSNQRENIVAIGNQNGWQGTWSGGDRIADDVAETVLIGDRNASEIQGLENVIGIGDFTLCCSASDQYPVDISDIIAIGDSTGSGIIDETSVSVYIGVCAGCMRQALADSLSSGGTEQIGIGDSASDNAAGTDTIAIGNTALGGWFEHDTTTWYDNLGNDIVAIGNHALTGNTTGSDNIAIGDFAGCVGCTENPTQHIGFANTTGSHNIWIGDTAGQSTATQLSNVIGIGWNAQNTQSNQIWIGNSDITSLIIFGCPTGQSVLDDGSGTCYVPGTSSFITSLTTTGSSGPATVISGVLNIPQYSGGGGGVSGSGTTGTLPIWTGTTALGNSHLDETTNAGMDTFTQPVVIAGATHGITIPAGTAVSGVTGKVVYTSDSVSGFAEVNENNTGLSRICTAGNGICAGGTPAFSSLTSGTNTAAAMVVGTGASIGVSGSGTIAATSAPASGLTGSTLASGVTASSLTSVGTLTGGSTGAGFTVALGTSTITGNLAQGHGGTGVSNTATLTLGSSNQNWATLGTGIVKNTTTTGAISNAASADVIALWTGSCSSSTFLRGDGACASASGSTGISGLTSGFIPLAGSATTITANSHIDDGVTTAATLTATEPIVVTGSTHGITIPAGTPVSGGSGKVVYTSDSTSGFAEVNENNTGLSRVCTAANGICAGGTGTLVASAEVVSFSATPTFSVATNVSRIVMTGNITSFTLGTGADGQDKTLCFAQDSTGSRTVIPPASVHGFFTVGSTASTWSCQTFAWDNADSIWLATSPGVVSQ